MEVLLQDVVEYGLDFAFHSLSFIYALDEQRKAHLFKQLWLIVVCELFLTLMCKYKIHLLPAFSQIAIYRTGGP